MSSVIFASAQRIIKQILDALQSGAQNRTADLITDTFSGGINNATSSGEGFLVVPGTNNTSATPTVNVTLGGIAYDPTGARIFISSSDTTLYNAANPLDTTFDGVSMNVPTPQSTGVINIPVTQSSQNYLWIDYLATIDPTVFTLNRETNAKQFYSQTDGYNIQVTTVDVAPDANSIYLANINMLGGGAVASSNISQVGRTYYQILPNVVPIVTPLANLSDRTPQYNPATTYTLEAHIKAVGTGTGISPTNPHNTSLQDLGVGPLDTVASHRQLEHETVPNSGNASANAIIAGIPGTPSPTTSAMATSVNIVNPGSDYLTVFALSSTEFAIVNGTAYNTTTIFGGPSNANIFFPNASGTYNVYWDSTTKAFSSSTSDISADVTKLWLATVTYTYVGSGPLDHNALSALTDRRRLGATSHLLQRWLTSARPGAGSTAPSSGEFGFNLSTGLMEYWDGSAWQQPVVASANSTVPTGAMLDFGGFVAPMGFLLCDGSAVSRTTYASLFATISTIWGPGDGSTTFNLPDARRRVAMGSGGTGTGVIGNATGNTGGSETHTLTNSEVPTLSDPGHLHRLLSTTTSGAKPAVTFADSNSNGVASTATSTDPDAYFTSAAHGPQLVESSSTGISYGGNGPHSIVQSSMIVTRIIKI